MNKGKGVTTFKTGIEKNKTIPQNTEKQLQKITKFEKKLNNKKTLYITHTLVRQNISVPKKKYKEITFYWTETNKRIEKYERLLKKQKIRFRKTMNNVKTTFTWDTTEVSFL